MQEVFTWSQVKVGTISPRVFIFIDDFKVLAVIVHVDPMGLGVPLTTHVHFQLSSRGAPLGCIAFFSAVR